MGKEARLPQVLHRNQHTLQQLWRECQGIVAGFAQHSSTRVEVCSRVVSLFRLSSWYVHL